MKMNTLINHMLLKCLTLSSEGIMCWGSSVSNLGRDSSPSALLKAMFPHITLIWLNGRQALDSNLGVVHFSWRPYTGMSYDHHDLPNIPEYFPCHKESCPEYCSAGKSVCEMFASSIPETNSYKHEIYMKHPTGFGTAVGGRYISK